MQIKRVNLVSLPNSRKLKPVCSNHLHKDSFCHSPELEPMPKMSDVLRLNQTLDPKFFANAELQKKAPGAFALQPEAAKFHEQADNSVEQDRLLELLQGIPQLQNFDQLDWAEKKPLLKVVFALECAVMDIEPPKLVIEDDSVPGPAFYDFDTENPDPGTVFLNPKALDENGLGGFPALELLIHETRHSAQFQHAFSGADDALAKGYKEAFVAQRALSEFSFVDFCTLLNEYEAFQFSNGVVARLTQGRADSTRMGTLASQHDSEGNLKLDLKELFRTTPHDEILDKFNQLEKPHYEEMNGNSARACC